jgi:hypothetical protein
MVYPKNEIFIKSYLLGFLYKHGNEAFRKDLF